MRKNIVELDRLRMTLWRMRIVSWRTKAKTHSEYVTVTAFPLQKWFHERASVLRYTCMDWLVLPVFST